MSKAPAHILMAEEDAFLGEIYKKRLEDVGYKVTLVHNGDACIREVEKKTPRLVILDILLPKLDGFRVLEVLKTSSKTKHIPVVVLTHLGQKEDVKKALHLGAHEYMLKAHVKPDDLLAKIQEILG